MCVCVCVCVCGGRYFRSVGGLNDKSMQYLGALGKCTPRKFLQLARGSLRLLLRPFLACSLTCSNCCTAFHNRSRLPELGTTVTRSHLHSNYTWSMRTKCLCQLSPLASKLVPSFRMDQGKDEQTLAKLYYSIICSINCSLYLAL